MERSCDEEDDDDDDDKLMTLDEFKMKGKGANSNGIQHPLKSVWKSLTEPSTRDDRADAQEDAVEEIFPGTSKESHRKQSKTVVSIPLVFEPFHFELPERSTNKKRNNGSSKSDPIAKGKIRSVL